jgi:MFS family permease
LFGRKLIFQAAVTFFVIGSVLCGLSQSMAMLVGARALQGIGGGAITVTATPLIGEVIPLRDRGRYQGALGAVFGVTTVIGPLLGGYFTDHLTWRWASWVNVPVSIVVFFVAAAAIPTLAARGRPIIDYTGILFVGLGATGLTLATSWGGTTYPWNSATIIGLFAGSTAALGIFVWIESRVAAPILPTRLFGSPVFTFDRLVRRGYAQRDVDRLWLTAAGARQVDFVSALIRDWIVDKLTRSPNFEGPPDRVSVEAALDRIARRIVAQPDWGDDQPKLSELATQRLRLAPSGVPSRHEPNRNIP